MKVIVKTGFSGRPDDEVLAREIKVGEVLTGDLARVAIESEWADVVEPPKAAEPPAPPNPPADPLDDMTVEQLKTFAAEKAIDLGEAKLKAEIRAAIDAALQKAAEAASQTPAA